MLWPNVICISLFYIFSLPYNVQAFASFWLSAWKFNGVVNIYAVGWMPLNAVVNNCWNWTIPVNCAQYGSASFMLDISEWGKLECAHDIVEIQFWISDKYSFEYLINTVFKIRETGLNDVELLGSEHFCQLLATWIRLIYVGYIWMRKTWMRTWYQRNTVLSIWQIQFTKSKK